MSEEKVVVALLTRMKGEVNCCFANLVLTLFFEWPRSLDSFLFSEQKSLVI